MKSAIVLGGGMVGSAVAADLAAGGEFRVTVADVREDRLARVRERCGAATVGADLSDAARVREVVAGHDIVVGALSSALGLATLRAVIEAGRDYCDISFMAEDPRPLGDLARQRGVTVVYDCGVAPGMTNMLAARAVALLDPCERLDLYVGGVPAEPRPPFRYKAAFAPADVLEEYTRPVRLVEDGRAVVRDALSSVEEFEFPGVGRLEAFDTDGLRSLVDTLRVPSMREKTMRWPGHATLMRAFRETGLFSKEPIEVGGVTVRPLDVTSAVLFPHWTYGPGEADLTAFRVVAQGRRGGARVRLTWTMLDRYDPETDTRSMSRTTGFPAAIMARAIASRRFAAPGVHPPEVPARDAALLDHLLAEQERRGVVYRFAQERLPA